MNALIYDIIHQPFLPFILEGISRFREPTLKVRQSPHGRGWKYNIPSSKLTWLTWEISPFFTKEIHLHSWWIFQPAILVGNHSKNTIPIYSSWNPPRFACQSFKSGDGWPGCLPVFDKCPTSIFFHPGKAFTPLESTRRVPRIISLLDVYWVVTGLFHLLINRVYCDYNPLTDLLLTSWDIQGKTWNTSPPNQFPPKRTEGGVWIHTIIPVSASIYGIFTCMKTMKHQPNVGR